MLSGHSRSVIHLDFSPDGKRLASASGDGTLKIWDVATNNCLAMLSGHRDLVHHVAFSPDGKKIASASDDRTLKIWDAETHSCLATLTGHRGDILHLAFSPDGTRIASASLDRTLKIWDAATDRCLATLSEHDNAVNHLAFSPDGRRLASASDDCHVGVCQCDGLPEERLAAAVQHGAVFDRLPRFVKNRLCYLLHLIHQQSRQLPPNCSVYKEEQFLQASAEDRQWAVDLYLAKHFLDHVAEAFAMLSTQEARPTTLPDSPAHDAAVRLMEEEAQQSFNRLPLSIQNSVYGELYRIHMEAGKLSQATPSNYGELAFLAKEGFTATDEERVQAISAVYPAMLRALGLTALKWPEDLK
jgi:hypothetical protein